MADDDEIASNEIASNEIASNEIASNEIADEIEEDEIDTDWVDEYNRIERNYNDFYNVKVNTIRVFFMYINNDNIVVNIKKETVNLNVTSILSREQLLSLIKENQNDGVKYRLFSLLRYNINLEPDEIEMFTGPSASTSTSTSKAGTSPYESRFLTNIEDINDIHFNDTIGIFQDLNAVYIFLKEKKHNVNRQITRKIKSAIKRRQTRSK
jgi:hypothetical protein